MVKKRPLSVVGNTHLRLNSTAAAVAAAAAANPGAASGNAPTSAAGGRTSSPTVAVSAAASLSTSVAGGGQNGGGKSAGGHHHHPDQLLIVSSTLNSSQMLQHFGNCTKEIPNFPSLRVPEGPDALPTGITASTLEEFVGLYKKHCGEIFEAVMMINFAQ